MLTVHVVRFDAGSGHALRALIRHPNQHSPQLTLSEPKDAFGDDVFLDLIGAAIDALRAGTEIGGDAWGRIDRMAKPARTDTVLELALAMRRGDVQVQRRDLLSGFGREDLDDRGFFTRAAAILDR
mgnify:CR=1 FL=1